MTNITKFDTILSRQCRYFEDTQFNINEWSYGYDTSLAFAFAAYFENLDDYEIAEWFDDCDPDLEQTEQLRAFFNKRFDERLTENHKFLMSNLTGGMIYG